MLAVGKATGDIAIVPKDQPVGSSTPAIGKPRSPPTKTTHCFRGFHGTTGIAARVRCVLWFKTMTANESCFAIYTCWRVHRRSCWCTGRYPRVSLIPNALTLFEREPRRHPCRRLAAAATLPQGILALPRPAIRSRATQQSIHVGLADTRPRPGRYRSGAPALSHTAGHH